MKRIDYIIEQNNPPQDKTVLWLKEGNLRYYENGEWISIVGDRYPLIRKVTKYLYKADYDRLNYKLAQDYLEGLDTATHAFGCSSFRNNSFLCRNYDWFYDESATFVVTTPAYDNKFATIGVANGVFNQTSSTSPTVINRAIELMPFYLLDGINEMGVFCSLNVVPTDKGISTATAPIMEERDRICNVMLGRYIIDNFASAEEALTYIKNYVSVYPSKALQSMNYEIHYLIGDANNTYVLEIVNNEIVYKAHNIMTNFYIDGVTFNSDNTVCTPADVPLGYLPSIVNNITDFGSGLERYNTIVSSINNVVSKASARQLLKDIYFTRAYRADVLSMPEWYSDFVGHYSSATITVDSLPEDIDPIIVKARRHYYGRNRNIKNTWQTVHSSIYDIDTRTIYITSQEENIEYKFSLEASSIGEGSNVPPTNNHILISNSIGKIEDSGVSVEDIKVFEKGEGAHSAKLIGENNHARGEASVAEGINTTTNNQAEHAEGRYNYSHTGNTEADNTQHSIGIGHATQDMSGRKNAVEVMQNGDIYILGIGGYNGTNPSESQSLQEIINEFTSVSVVLSD